MFLGHGDAMGSRGGLMEVSEMAGGLSEKVAVWVEPTPNPNSLKFIVARELIPSGSYDFADREVAAQSPLARSLFDIPGVQGVFVGTDFITLRKDAATAWEAIEPRAVEVIQALASAEGAIVGATGQVEHSATAGDAESRIRRILDEEIRPAVSMDGGDVVFQSWEPARGVLTLRLVGACSGCPSSIMTLRMGIERRLKEDIPELTEVVSTM